VRRAAGLLAVVALVVGVVAAGYVVADAGSSRNSRVHTRAPSTSAPSSSAPSSSATSTTTAAPSQPSPVTFAFGGDVHFEGTLRSRAVADPGALLAPIARVLASADVAVVNLETAVTDRGTPAPKQYTFRAPVAGLVALRDAGVDVATMANNHGMDYGAVGLEDSLAASRSTGFPVIGIGENAAQAYAPWRTVVRGTRVAVMGATQVLDDVVRTAWTATDTHAGLASAKEIDRFLDEVRAVRPTTDVLVVYVHWGVEGATCPTSAQQTLARQLVEAGADVVVGSHSHRVEGAGRLGDALVDYGLGNFVFYNESGPSGVSGVLKVTTTGRHVDAYAWVPAAIGSGVPRPLSGAAASAAAESWTSARSCTGLGP